MISLLLLTTGCSTALEVMEGSSGGYYRSKDPNGNTKYVRTRFLDTDGHSTLPTYHGNPYGYDYGYSDNSPPQPLPEALNAVANVVAAATNTTVQHVAADYVDTSNHQLYHDAVAAIDLSPDQDDNPYRGGGLAFSISSSKDTANGDISYEWMSEYVSGGGGVSFVSSDRTYFGFNGQVRVHFPWIVSPYVGVGAYLGDSKSCSYKPAQYGYTKETCEKYYLFAGTADLGLQFNFDKNFVVRAYARGFSRTRQGDPLGDTLYGTSFAFVF